MTDSARTGYVVTAEQVATTGVAGSNASVRVPIDRSVGCQNLIQRVFRYGVGQSAVMTNEGSEDVIYVTAGEGFAVVDGHSHALKPDTGLFVPPGSTYYFINPGPADLEFVSVLSPQPGYQLAYQAEAELREDGRLTTTEAEEPPIPVGDRYFKYIINHRFGCKNVTQFVGFIPPSKAPFHTHTYEEVIYILEGEGIVHIENGDYPVTVGSSIYLPPGSRHCIENPGTAPLRLLGVFCPAGDPGSRTEEKS